MTTAVRLLTVADRTGARALTAREVAKVYQCGLGHVYNMAARDKWRRVRHHGRIYYHPGDVDKTLGRDGTCGTTPM